MEANGFKSYRRRQISSIAIACCMLLIHDACGVKVSAENLADDTRMTVQEIAKLHARFNSKNFDDIYSHQTQALQQSISKEDFRVFLNSVMDSFGQFRSIIDKRINIVMQTPVQFRAVCNCQFDRGVLTEMFVFLKGSDEVQLAHYKISKGPAKLPMVGSD